MKEVFCWAALVCFLDTPVNGMDFTTQVVALSGDLAPDGNGTLSSLFAPVLNDAGQVMFAAEIGDTGGGDSGLFRGNGDSLTQIARVGQEAPDGNGSFAGFGRSVLNSLGQVAFDTVLTDTNDGSNDDHALFLGDGTTLAQVVREGDPAPDGDGRFRSDGFRRFSPTLNDSGNVAFLGYLRDTSNDVGLFQNDGTILTQIARKGQAPSIPPGSREFQFFGAPKLNNAGMVAFIGFNGPSNNPGADNAIYRNDGNSLTSIALSGQTNPDGSAVFASLFNVAAINEGGEVAFAAELLVQPSDPNILKSGLYRGDETAVTEIARFGDPAPDGNGTFFDIDFRSAFNNAGQAAFTGVLADTNSSNEALGVFRGDGDTLTQVARASQPAPDGNGELASRVDTMHPAINNAGQVVFEANLIRTTGGLTQTDDAGIFFFDDRLGLLQVARKGDNFLGSTITDLSFAIRDDVQNGLNDRGQVAYQFTLADGRQGIAVATLIPEPSSFALLCLICLVGLCSRRATEIGQ